VTIKFSPQAEADFVAVIDYLCERNPAAAHELSDRIFVVIDKLAAHELEGPEQMLSSEIVRSWPVPPVRIYYQRTSTAFWVVRIYHQSRTPVAR
jgi:plasmid stabilization system protein ParE